MSINFTFLSTRFLSHNKHIYIYITTFNQIYFITCYQYDRLYINFNIEKMRFNLYLTDINLYLCILWNGRLRLLLNLMVGLIIIIWKAIQ